MHVHSACVQLAVGASDRTGASDVLWPDEESHRCCSNTGSLSDRTLIEAMDELE